MLRTINSSVCTISINLHDLNGKRNTGYFNCQNNVKDYARMPANKIVTGGKNKKTLKKRKENTS